LSPYSSPVGVKIPENTNETKLVNFAMANAARRKIINFLEEGDKNIEEIKGINGDATLDFHLKILQQANLIELEEETVKLNEYGKKFLKKKKIEKSIEKPAALSTAKPVEIADVRQLLPCIADSSKFRAVADMEPPPGEILKILEPLFPRGKYSDRKSSLIIRNGEIITTLYGSGKVSMRMIKNEDEPKEELERLKGIINEAIAKGVPPAPVEKIKVEIMDIYKNLPQTNCGKCNEQGCYTFAIKLMAGETNLDKCPPLKERTYAANQERLEILSANI
jgi:ArsR family metal-binding transcriptional regulator